MSALPPPALAGPVVAGKSPVGDVDDGRLVGQAADEPAERADGVRARVGARRQDEPTHLDLEVPVAGELTLAEVEPPRDRRRPARRG